MCKLAHTNFAMGEQVLCLGEQVLCYNVPPSVNSSPSAGFLLEGKEDGDTEWYSHTSLESTQQLISCSCAHREGSC